MKENIIQITDFRGPSNVTRFNRFDHATNSFEDFHDLEIDYGEHLNSDPNNIPRTTTTKNRRRAILYTQSTGYVNWVWSADNKAHFVCHSQGGNTVRYLFSLMKRGTPITERLEYFREPREDEWAISVVTLGTPHRGTTIIDALKRFSSVSLGFLVCVVQNFRTE
jgi:hypothetical protein